MNDKNQMKKSYHLVIFNTWYLVVKVTLAYGEVTTAPSCFQILADDFPLGSGGGKAPARYQTLGTKIYREVLSQPRHVELRPLGLSLPFGCWVPFVLSGAYNSLAVRGERASASKMPTIHRASEVAPEAIQLARSLNLDHTIPIVRMLTCITHVLSFT